MSMVKSGQKLVSYLYVYGKCGQKLVNYLCTYGEEWAETGELLMHLW